MVPTEGCLVDIPLEVHLTQPMENTLLCPLKNRIERFCGVVVDFSAGKLQIAVVHI